MHRLGTVWSLLSLQPPRRMLAVVVLLTAGLAAAEDQQQRGLALVTRAALLGSLRTADSRPFRLRAHVRLFGLVSGTREGEYVLTFGAPDQWCERLQFPGYSEVAGLWQGEQWRKRNTVDRPFRFHETLRLFDLASHLRLAPGATVRRLTERQDGAATTMCIEVSPGREVWQRETVGKSAASELSARKGSSYTLCFDGESGALMSARYTLPLPRFDYTGGVTLGNKSFPKVLRCFEANDLAVEAIVEELVALESFDPGVVVPPAGASRWPACDSPEPPRMLVKREAEHSSHAKARRQFGTVVFLAEVGMDGLLHDLTAVQAKGWTLAEPVRDAVEGWRYQPATCSGAPVPMQIYLAYTFLP